MDFFQKSRQVFHFGSLGTIFIPLENATEIIFQSLLSDT